MNSPTLNNNIKKMVAPIVVAIIALGLVYGVVHAVTIARSTGTLQVHMADSKAVLNISQPNHQARRIGVGNSRVRLQPGNYLLTANDNGITVTKVVTIHKQQITTEVLDLPQSRPRTKSDINFSGIDVLLKYGVTTAQLSNLEQAYFQFASSAHTVAIDTASVGIVPHDRNSASTTNTINFTVSIDKTSYKARFDYSDLTATRLYLYDAKNGSQIYDSNPTNAGV